LLLQLIDAAAPEYVRNFWLAAVSSFSHRKIFLYFTLGFIFYPRLVAIPSKHVFPAHLNAIRPNDGAM